MTLDQYLAHNALTEAAFASSVGVDQSTVHRLRAKGQTPNKSLMARIFDVTAGAVRADDFFGLPASPPCPLCDRSSSDSSTTTCHHLGCPIQEAAIDAAADTRAAA